MIIAISHTKRKGLDVPILFDHFRTVEQKTSISIYFRQNWERVGKMMAGKKAAGTNEIG